MINGADGKKGNVTIQMHETVQAQSELHLYPNPAGPSVSLFFDVPWGFPGKRAVIEIFDITGRLVWRAENPVAPGLNKAVWNGVDNNGHTLPAGKYQVRVALGKDVLEQDFSRIL
jgi:flagellar hook assembly protein FlgD